MQNLLVDSSYFVPNINLNANDDSSTAKQSENTVFVDNYFLKKKFNQGQVICWAIHLHKHSRFQKSAVQRRRQWIKHDNHKLVDKFRILFTHTKKKCNRNPKGIRGHTSIEIRPTHATYTRQRKNQSSLLLHLSIATTPNVFFLCWDMERTPTSLFCWLGRWIT